MPWPASISDHRIKPAEFTALFFFCCFWGPVLGLQHYEISLWNIVTYEMSLRNIVIQIMEKNLTFCRKKPASFRKLSRDLKMSSQLIPFLWRSLFPFCIFKMRKNSSHDIFFKFFSLSLQWPMFPNSWHVRWIFVVHASVPGPSGRKVAKQPEKLRTWLSSLLMPDVPKFMTHLCCFLYPSLIYQTL